MPFSLRWSEQLADLLMLWVVGGGAGLIPRGEET